MISLATLAAAAADVAADHSKASGGLFLDTAFWVLIAFFIVIGIFWRAGVHKTIASGLDKRSQRIADEIDEARRLREEAQELLAQYQRRQREAEGEAQAIIEQAKRDAIRLGEEARAKLSEQVERRTKAAEDKISRAEAQAISEVRGQTVDLAVAAAQVIIKDRMDGGAQSLFIDKAINGLQDKLN